MKTNILRFMGAVWLVHLHLPAFYEPRDDPLRISIEVGAQQSLLGFELLLRVTDQYPAHGHCQASPCSTRWRYPRRSPPCVLHRHTSRSPRWASRPSLGLRLSSRGSQDESPSEEVFPSVPARGAELWLLLEGGVEPKASD